MFTTYLHRLFSLHGILALCSVYLFQIAPSVTASQLETESSARVVFLPFSIQVPGPYAHLENGLSSMLQSRLASRAEITAVNSSESGKRLLNNLRNNTLKSFARELAQTKAEYLILGSLDIAQNGYQLTAYVFSKDITQAPHSFQESIHSIDDAMTAMDRLSWTISEQIFAGTKPDQQPLSQEASSGMVALRTRHPDRIYREGLFTTADIDFASGAPFKLASTYRSPKIHDAFMDLNTADLDGDDHPEILALANTRLYIYQFIEENFVKIGEIPLARHLRLHAVTTADLDHNGIPELYISGNNGADAVSSIMEWRNGSVKKLATNIPYYLVAAQEQGKPVLYGQKPRINQPYGGPIYTFKRQTWHSFEPINRPALPKGISVYDFIRTDIDKDGRLETIAITSSDRLQVLDTAGTVLWTSQDTYGASRNFFGTLSSNEEQDSPPVFLKTRLVASDMDGDGANDIIVVRNRAKTVPFLPSLRYFDGSTITAMTWKERRLKPLWETQRLAGYVVNTQVLSQKNNLYQLVFGEAETRYPFAVWQASAMTLNTYSFQRADRQITTP